MDYSGLEILYKLLTEVRDLKHTEEESITGNLILSADIISNIEVIYSEDIFELVNDKGVIDIDDINNYSEENIQITIYINNISSFFSSFESFLQGNSLGLQSKSFFIFKENILVKDSAELSHKLPRFNNCLQILELIDNLSNEKIQEGNALSFFYSIKNNSFLKIEAVYTQEDFQNLLDDNSIQIIKQELLSGTNIEDKRKVFINELNSLRGNEAILYFGIILKEWNKLILNYNLSYQLYLEGFSVEKLKVTANEYFIKITEKIYESISKISAYLFGIPIGYLVLISSYDFTNENFIKNFLILLISTIFFMFVYFIFCKNIEENIDAINEELIDFETRLGNANSVNFITEKIKSIRENKIKKQSNKLSLIKTLSIIIYGLSVLVFIFLMTS